MTSKMCFQGSAANLERHFVAYGVRIALRVDDLAVFEALGDETLQVHLPFGWHAEEENDPAGDVAVRYEICSRALNRPFGPYRLYAGWELIAEAGRLIDVVRALGSHAELFVAARAPEHLFVHAGVVGWQDRAIVMPGSSFAGKTTLVQSWLEAGATYYSDEFAVLDRTGRVHPFTRSLAIRDGSMRCRVPAIALGAPVGTVPLPVGIVAATAYRSGASWRPSRLTAGPALLAMMRHTVAARGRPEHSMPILKQVVMNAVTLAGPRGEARSFVSAVIGKVCPQVS